MIYLFELSKEHHTLPTAEIVACLKAENVTYNIIEENEDVLIIETDVKEDSIKRVANRLSLTFYINEFLFSCQPDSEQIAKKAIKHPIRKEGSIAIQCKKRSTTVDSQPIVKALANIYTKDRRVILEHPDIEVRGFITNSNIYTGVKLAEINRSQFEQRKVQHRPFFSPISLHPKLARALVNLSTIQKGGTLLDPFCGTGGILLEAGLIGAQVIGSDVEQKMIDGCKKTLDFYNVENYKIFCSDIGDINSHVAEIDAVVTDLPYGKATTTKGENIIQLYERAFENISNMLKKRGRAVIGLSNKNMISVGKRYFSLLEHHEWRAHRSLTRYFVIYQK
jgi:tRNA (guanine10-N2)-dimethyltransferase